MNAIKDVMMNKVLAGEAGKEKAREWGRWLATDEGQAYPCCANGCRFL